MSLRGLPDHPGFGTDARAVRGFGTADKTKAGLPKETGLLTSCFSISSGATRRNRTGDLLITKYRNRLQAFQWLYTDCPVFNNLGNLLSPGQ